MADLGPVTTHEREIRNGERFSFGENWTRFLGVLDEKRIQEAVDSLKRMLEVETLQGMRFLDAGSGSGLFSLAARRLGAKVVSFDYDPKSVACTNALKARYYKNDDTWEVQAGSVLDNEYLGSLGEFDVVYSWGVLHHTGAMWAALDRIEKLVAAQGKLFIALYNHQPFASRYWTFVKKTYNKYPLSRPIFIFIHAIYPTLPGVLLRLLTSRGYPRGMAVRYDLYDWLGGYPFEVSKPEDIFNFYKARKFQLCMLKTVGGRMGCNEFVFRRNNPAPQ
jgi:SAM-dependent methyltransferase